MLLTVASVDDTIAAVSSPPGRSPRALLRLAGPEVRRILARLLEPPPDTDKAEDSLVSGTHARHAQAPPPGAHDPPPGATDKRSPRSLSVPPRTLTPAPLRTPPVPALAAFMPGPGTYTGQDLAELQLPGHPALLERVLAAALAAGARLAEPGEFTFRAYVAGRVDLTQAEGVAAAIAARSDAELAAADHLRAGELGAWSRQLVDRLGEALALVEAGVDFTDEQDVTPITADQLDATLGQVQQRLAELARRARPWGSLDALPRVVLVGPPSAGKSTLFNALLGRSRAVVDHAPGTTRDVLAEPLTLTGRDGRGVEVMLTDIAGLDAPAAALDAHIQRLARDAIDRADLLLVVSDAVGGATPLPLDLPADRPAIDVHNKIDLARPQEISDQKSAIAVSARTGRGLDALRRAIAEHVAERGVSLAADMLALQPRHQQALDAAAAALREARAMLAGRGTIDHPELVAATIRRALDELAALGGELSPDDVIGRIFARFCIGK